jgi:hypothetical protein
MQVLRQKQQKALLLLPQTLVLWSQTQGRLVPSQKQVLLLPGCQTLVQVLRLLVHQKQGQMRQECQKQTQRRWVLQSHWVSQSWCCRLQRLKQTQRRPCQRHWVLLPGSPLLLLAWILQHSIKASGSTASSQGGASASSHPNTLHL